MSRKVLRRKHRKVTVGDLDKLVKIQTRTMEAPTFDETDFAEDFDCPSTTWAKVVTTGGKVIMNAAGIEVKVTHEVTIRYVEGIDTEDWVLLENGSRLRVLDVEDLEERNEYLVLSCADRGDRETEAARA